MTDTVLAPPQRRPLPWLAILVLAYAAAAMILLGNQFWGALAHYFGQLNLLLILMMVGLPLAGLIVSPQAPLVGMFGIMRRSGPRLVAILVFFCIGMAAFTTYKLAIPQLMPFYADAILADADAWLHGGDPGLYLHAVLPEWVAGPILRAYGPVWFTLWFGMVGYVALQPDAVLRRRYFYAMAFTFALLGSLLATAMSSVGPIYYDLFIPGDRFSALMEAVHAGAAGPAIEQTAAYLLAAHEGSGATMGTGISAMPSMHLAVATLQALALSRLGRPFAALGWAFVFVIQVGSVYLGWHYALDGYVSILAVCLIWRAVGRFDAHVHRDTIEARARL